MFTFDEVIGQERVKRLMLDAFHEGHIPHAWLLSGPEGVGKMALALAFSRLLLCQGPEQEPRPCQRCRSCHQMDGLVHPDLHFLFPYANHGAGKAEDSDDYLQEFRKLLLKSPYFSLREQLEAVKAGDKMAMIYASDSDKIFLKMSKKSLEGGWKVVIIYLPERCNEAMSNKMLKLLEEPPERTLFLMLSVQPEMLLPTIRSRVQELRVGPIEAQDLLMEARRRHDLPLKDLQNLVHLSGGSLMRLEEVLSQEDESREDFDRFVSLMRLAYMRKLRELKTWSDEAAALGKERQKEFLAYAQRMIRESFIRNFQISELNYMTPSETDFTARFCPFINTRNAMQLQGELEKAETQIERNVNKKMVFFDLAIKIIILLKQ